MLPLTTRLTKEAGEEDIYILLLGMTPSDDQSDSKKMMTQNSAATNDTWLVVLKLWLSCLRSSATFLNKGNSG